MPGMEDEKAPLQVLVTGASGRIGHHLLDELRESGFRIRAVTGKPLSPQQRNDRAVHWVQHDFMNSQDVGKLVAGCEAVFHLAAEVWNIPRIQMLNINTTRALAEAAARCGVRFFCFTSSTAVYGSAKTKNVNENTPLLTPDKDVKSEYRGNASIRTYGRSKVQNERDIAAQAKNMETIILRLTKVVDLKDIVSVASRNTLFKFILGNRHEHLIYVKDVAHAMVWFLQRSLQRTTPAPGVEIFNLSDDSAGTVTGTAISRKAWELTHLQQFRTFPAGPLWVYDLFDLLKNKTLSFRVPLGKMNFSSDKLFASGYRFKFGLDKAICLAATSQSQTVNGVQQKRDGRRDEN